MQYFDIHYAYTCQQPTQHREHGIVTLRAKSLDNARRNARAYLSKSLTAKEMTSLNVYIVNVSLFAE